MKRTLTFALAAALLVGLVWTAYPAMTAVSLGTNDATGAAYYSVELDAPAGATTEIVAAVSGKQIRVISAFGIANVAGTVTFKSGSTAVSGDLPLLPGGGFVLPPFPAGGKAAWMITDSGEALSVTTVTCTLDGVLVYALE